MPKDEPASSLSPHHPIYQMMHHLTYKDEEDL
jgi:hypothetical protein